jgi:uncharacterized glyoxalase superfamily protein PhnB
MFFKAIPTLSVPDVLDASAFYADVLQFKKGWTWGEPPRHASVSLEEIEIHFAQGKAEPTEAFWIYLSVGDIEKIYDHCKNSNLPLKGELEEKPWGMREFTILDLNGYKLRFGSSTE